MVFFFKFSTLQVNRTKTVSRNKYCYKNQKIVCTLELPFVFAVVMECYSVTHTHTHTLTPFIHNPKPRAVYIKPVDCMMQILIILLYYSSLIIIRNNYIKVIQDFSILFIIVLCESVTSSILNEIFKANEPNGKITQ